MPTQLILFAGLHKTGTTSIQETCRKNGPPMHRAGFWYPVVNIEGRDLANHTTLFNLFFKREPYRAGLGGQFEASEEFDEPEALRALREKFFHIFKDAPRVLAVAEGVSVLSLEELKAMRDWIAGLGWETRVICHVRHLSGWFNSIVSQRVTSPLRMSIPAVVDEFMRYGGGVVRPRIENLRAVFPQAEFYSHEQAVKDLQGPVGYFFDKIGFKPGPNFKFVRANEGRSDAATRTMSLLNERFGLFDANGRKNPLAIDKLKALHALFTLPGRKFSLRPDEVAPILPVLQAENEWLRETLGPDFHDLRLEFTARPLDWTRESFAQFAKALAALPPEARSHMVQGLEALDVPPRVAQRLAQA